MKHLYPGVVEAERQRSVLPPPLPEEPDVIRVPTTEGWKFCPNYDKFHGVDPSMVLAWCNMD